MEENNAESSECSNANVSTGSALSEISQAILSVVADIPPGKVATYGQIAALAGVPGAARAVGRSLRYLPEDTRLPWHRVLNASGKISIPQQGASIQKARLESEGIVFLRGKVSLQEFQWQP